MYEEERRRGEEGEKEFKEGTRTEQNTKASGYLQDGMFHGHPTDDDKISINSWQLAGCMLVLTLA